MGVHLRKQNRATSVPQGKAGNVGTFAAKIGAGFTGILGIAGGIVADKAISSIKKTNARVRKLKAKDRARANAVNGTGRR